MSRAQPPALWNFRRTWPVLVVLVLVAPWKQVSSVPPAQQPDAKSLFANLCAVCHGQTGAGDGPAAAALKLRPASFTDTAFQAARTDDQLAAMIAGGKPPMPGFGQQLSPVQVKSLVVYLRQLGRQAKKKKKS